VHNSATISFKVNDRLVLISKFEKFPYFTLMEVHYGTTLTTAQ